MEQRLFQTFRPAPRYGPLDHGARQPRKVRACRRGVVPLPRPCSPENECAEISKSFVIALGGLGFVVMDSGKIANENGSDDDDDDDDSADASRTEDLTPIVKQRYAEIARSVPSPGWLLTHAPFNAVRFKHHETEVDNTLQQEAIGGLLPSNIKMIVSGHIHIFEALSFADADPPRPPQLVVGTGGVKLAKEPDVPKKINGARVTGALSRH